MPTFTFIRPFSTFKAGDTTDLSDDLAIYYTTLGFGSTDNKIIEDYNNSFKPDFQTQAPFNLNQIKEELYKQLYQDLKTDILSLISVNSEKEIDVETPVENPLL